MTSAKFAGHRYILHEVVGRGGMGEVYRATDRLMRRTVALKMVTVEGEGVLMSTFGAIDSSLTLAREFRFLSSLRHPHIISVYDFGFDNHQQPFFTMDFLDNAQTIVEAARHTDLNTTIRYIVELLQALDYLHHQGIYHRDLKPSNILVSDDDLRVLDFGLAVERQSAEVLGGTLAYIAPEALQNQSPSVQSDLYGVGLIAYEALTKRHAFDLQQHMSGLINDILYTAPATTPLQDLGPYGQALTDIIMQLLQKSPDDRPLNARSVIDKLSPMLAVPLVPESLAIREGFLQRARFVGRDTELKTLLRDLSPQNAASERKWLVYGESGVGKSRLLDELRIQALVDGVMVLRGQAVSDGAAPYVLWQQLLRGLSLQLTLTDVEVAILQEIVPDLSDLLQQTPADVAILDPIHARERLSNTLRAVLKRLPQPTLLLFEDIQWAAVPSIALLKSIAEDVHEAPLMLVASVRSDAKTSHLDPLNDWQTIDLPRLDRTQIAELSSAMVGHDIGTAEQFLDLLQTETEGNIFFIVEVIRTLAERAGNLADVINMTLPTRILSGGMQTVLGTRVQLLPADLHDLLEVVAVLGRQLDMDVLRAIDAERLEPLLLAGANAAIFDYADDQWRFSHDKVREYVLDNLPPERVPTLHQSAAAALLEVYGDNPTIVGNLAYHYRHANDAANAIAYALKAGMQLLNNYARLEALTHFDYAIEQLEATNPNSKMLVRARHLRAEALYQADLSSDAYEAFAQTLEQADIVLPTTRRGWQLGIAKQLLIRAYYELTPLRWRESHEPAEDIIARARTAGRWVYCRRSVSNPLNTTILR